MKQIFGRFLMPESISGLIRFFLYVTIFWLPYSPAVVETSIILSFFLWVLKRSLSEIPIAENNISAKKRFLHFCRKFAPEKSRLNWPILIFLSICSLSVIGSFTFKQSLYNFFTKTLEWFVVYFLVLEVFKSRKHVWLLVTVLVFTAFSTSLDGIVQFYITNKDIFLGHVIEPGSRATAGFKTPNGLGGYLTLIIPITFALIFLRNKNMIYRVLMSVVCILMVWVLAVTFSRGAWIGTLAGFAFLLLMSLAHQKGRKWKVLLWVLVLITSFYVISIFWASRVSNLPFLDQRNTFGWRLTIWEDVLQMVKDKPFFGHGINTFMSNFEFYRRDVGTNPTYAHNCYLQMAAETGIMGLGAFLWIVGALFRESLKKININFSQEQNFMLLLMGLLSGIFAFLVHSFFDTHLYSLQLSLYLWFMVGILVASINLLPEYISAQPRREYG